MSSVLVIQQYDKVYIGSDTAISTKIKDKHYRIGNNGKKIFYINNQVIFCSGNLQLSYLIMDTYNNTKNKSIAKLQEIAKNICKSQNSEDLIEIIVVEKNLNRIEVYQISSYNDFTLIKRSINKNDTAMFAGGIKTKECFNASYLYYSQGLDVKNIYINTFNDISYECIGGNIILYEVNLNGINKILNKPIKENKNIKRIKIKDNMEHNLIISEQLYGKVIGSNKLIITNMNDKGESSFLVDGSHMKAINMDLSLLRKNLLNRIYMNPEVGFKIQKRDNKESDWRDLLWLDMDGEIYAKSFHVINTNTELNDKGLAVDNGKIKIVNENGQDAIYCDENGDMRLDGRLRVTRHLNKWKGKHKWDLEPEENRVILLDAYKDKEKGGKLLINDWNGNPNAFLGSPPNENYSGGFMKLFSGINADKISKGTITENDNSRERLEIGILKKEDTGVINIKNKDTKNIVSILGNDKSGEVIINNEKENPLISLKGNSEGGIIRVNGQEKGSINAFLGAIENDDDYEGGHLKLYNKKLDNQRIFLGIKKSDDAGSMELYSDNMKRNVLVSARDNENEWQSSGVVKLYNEKGDPSITLTADTNKNPMERQGISQMVFGDDVKHPKLGLYSGNGEYGSYIQMSDKKGKPQMFIGNVSKEETPGGCQVWYANMEDFSDTKKKRRVQIFVNKEENAEIDLYSSVDRETAMFYIRTKADDSVVFKHISGRQMTWTKNGKIMFS